jgi:hypothetical protein
MAVIERDRAQRCAFCGSTDRVEAHHLGGREHARYYTIPLCGEHHNRVTRAIEQMGRQSGVGLMQHTDDAAERVRRARLAALIFQWFVEEIVNPNQEKRR